jgi:hypothetical protein
LRIELRLCTYIVVAAVGVSLSGCGDNLEPDVIPTVCDQPPPASPSLQCGATVDFTPVNAYQGDLVSIHEREDAVVMLDGRCTGTLIAAIAGPVVLTAGHCVGLGDRPLVVFNFEDAPDGEALITEGTVIDQSIAPDYALIQLDVLPAATPTALAMDPSDQLAIIQHPRGRPKVVAEGRFLDSCDGLLYYIDLDTLVGSSGAGVLNSEGHLVGIHTDGDCDTKGGSNSGSSAASIVEASPYLEAGDIVVM